MFDRDIFKALIGEIADTREVEIGCDECFEQLDRFVEMKLSGLNAAQAMPLVQEHVEICDECREEFDALLAALRATGERCSAHDSPSAAPGFLQCVCDSFLEAQPPPFSPRRIPPCLRQPWTRSHQVRLLSRAYSRIVSSITKRGSSSTSSSCLKRLLSEREERPSRTSTNKSPTGSQMASTASRAYPSEKTESLAKSTCSPSSSRA